LYLSSVVYRAITKKGLVIASNEVGGVFDMDKDEIIEMALNDFGTYVRRTRQQYGMSLKDLAVKTNLSEAFIYRIEVGQRNALLNTRLVLLLCGFNWDTNNLMAYLERIIKDIKEFKRITN